MPNTERGLWSTGHGLYVHVPFCRRKCRYCDFFSRPMREGEAERFAECVGREAALRSGGAGREGVAAPRSMGVPPMSPLQPPERGVAQTSTTGETPVLREGAAVASVYFGGGTPSLLGAGTLARLLAALRRCFGIGPGAEITVEANPLDATPAWCEGVLRAGFNRVSIGVQSLDAADLAFLGRLHGPDEGPAAVAAAREAGFANLSIDLIVGLPGADAASTERAVFRALDACAPDHISCYMLTCPPDTPLGRDIAQGRVRPLDEDRELEAFQAAQDALAARGYAGYEVSNFARAPRFRSRHNANYWRHADYVGLGPAAHSFRWPERWWNPRSVETWAEALERGADPREGGEVLTPEQLACEAVMLALRTVEGLDLGSFRKRYGRDLLEEKGEGIARLVGEGLLVLEGERLRPTLRGLALADALAGELAS